MRENIGLFKAKDIKTKEWREGYYWTNEVGNHFLRVVRDKNNNFITPIDYEIDHETLCEFIGTIHGKEIFNNDKIKAKQFLFFGDDSVGIIVYNKSELNYIFQEQYTKDTIKLHTLRRLHEGSSDIEVIGNKFEEVESE